MGEFKNAEGMCNKSKVDDGLITGHPLIIRMVAVEPRRLIDYQPKDVDDALDKLLCLAAYLISERTTLTKSEMAEVLKSAAKF